MVINDESKATTTICHVGFLLNFVFRSPYHNLSPLSFLAARKPGNPSSELLLFFAWYSWSVPADTCLPAQCPNVSRSWKYGSCLEGSSGSGRIASNGTAKPHDVWTFKSLAPSNRSMAIKQDQKTTKCQVVARSGLLATLGRSFNGPRHIACLP
jgi:hypothetical protein